MTKHHVVWRLNSEVHGRGGGSGGRDDAIIAVPSIIFAQVEMAIGNVWNSEEEEPKANRPNKT